MIQVSQETDEVVWYSHLFQNFPQFVVIHTVKGLGILIKAEVDVFLELLLFRWSNTCWQFALWFLCLLQIQLEHLEVHGSRTVEAWLGEFLGKAHSKHRWLTQISLPCVSVDTASNVEISGSLSLTTIGIAFCAWPTDFPSAHTPGLTFCSPKGREPWTSWCSSWF